jgi:hypothetical protein
MAESRTHMNDHGTSADAPAPMNLSVDGQPGQNGADLDQRVQRLEAQVAALGDAKELEERIAQRVTERLRTSEQFTAKAPVTPGPAQADLPYEEPPFRPMPGHYAWLFVDMLADARLMFLMLLDRRYAMAWTTHLVVWLFVPAILLSGWWFPVAYFPILGPYLDKVLDLLLAFCVYKALSRETRRYREVLEHRR